MTLAELQPAYEFFAPRRIVFGWGRRREAGRLCATIGRRVFLVVGSRTLEASGAAREIEDGLRAAGLEVRRIARIGREPEVADVDAAARALREALGGSLDGACVVALGGGSAIDLAKAACAMASQPRETSVLDYLEGVGKGLEIERDPLPLVAIPTTAGTGSEATKNAVISSTSPPFKKSLRSDRMVPRLVLVDPELHVPLPPATTAYTGMDALTQLIESYISSRRAPIPRALALQGAAMAADALPRAVRDGADRDARERMAHAALLSGIALANSGLGLAHGVAASLGIHAGVAHGLACAVLLPSAIRANRSVRAEDMRALAEAMLRRSFPSPEAGADALASLVDDLIERAGIPRRLGDLGVAIDAIPRIVKGSYGNSMAGNPRSISEEELQAILEAIA